MECHVCRCSDCDHVALGSSGKFAFTAGHFSPQKCIVCVFCHFGWCTALKKLKKNSRVLNFFFLKNFRFVSLKKKLATQEKNKRKKRDGVWGIDWRARVFRACDHAVSCSASPKQLRRCLRKPRIESKRTGRVGKISDIIRDANAPLFKIGGRVPFQDAV